MKYFVLFFLISTLLLVNVSFTQKLQKPIEDLFALKVSKNKRYLVDEKGNPFFWLGDTGWLLFSKLNREEVDQYLTDRAGKGFNVVQAMALHSLKVVNVYGDSALINQNVSSPKVTDGCDFEDSTQYDFWDNVDYVVDQAGMKGIYVGMVPVWGSNIKGGNVTKDEAVKYAGWLANRYKDKYNIIWLVGGDVLGSDSLDIWNAIGSTINKIDTTHLITFHPFGRTSSSLWFQNEKWLDFNMFQSGHRRYDQDDTEWGFGQDNWKYVIHDYALKPVKPTIDGEPSYEGIPQGLHDSTQPYWAANDVRRYAYWSVFAGAFGFTYGANSVMQFYKSTDEKPAFGAQEFWSEGINLTGASQMQYLKNLMLSRPYLERIPDQSLIAGENGIKYDYIAATRGKNYTFLYTYTGRNIPVNLSKISSGNVKASWYKPKDGTILEIGEFENKDMYIFDPPGEPANGNDWVLILDSM